MTAVGSSQNIFDEMEQEGSRSDRRTPSLTSLSHFIWLKKWVILAIWLILAIPTGSLLSVFNLPKSYSAATIMRFPSVVGAQTNVMRDVAITQRESIISIFNSFQVLQATVQSLNLRLRIKTSDLFRKNLFRSVKYSESLGLGTYTINHFGHRQLSVVYRPRSSKSDYVVFKGAAVDNRLVLTGLELELTPSFFGAVKENSIQLELVELEEAIAEVRENLTARALGTSNFEVRLKERDPYLVADILNTLREQFLVVYYGTTEVQDVGILVQMEKDLESSKKRLEKSQDDLSKYYTSHPELVVRPQGNQGDNFAYFEARQQVESIRRRKDRVQSVMAAKDQAAQGDKKVFWIGELLQSMSDAGEPKASILRASLAELQGRRANLRGTLGPEHPRITEVETEMQELYDQAESVEGELVKRLEKELSEWKLNVAGSTPISAPTIPVKVQLELDRLASVNQNNEMIYNRLLESYNRAKLVTGSEFFKVTIVDPARPDIYNPPSLKARMIIAAAAVALLGVSTLMGFLAWPLVFVRIWTKDDVKKLLNLRLLGVVGLRAVPSKKVGRERAEDNQKKDEVGRGPQAKKEDFPASCDPLLLFRGSCHNIEDVEAFRIIREETENVFRNPERPGKYCLMVTSCHPHEGKSTCSSNLAMTFARKGKRTLLIDADFRMGRIHHIFNQMVYTGIDDILNQQNLSLPQFLELIPQAFQMTDQPNLVIAPRASPNPNAGELVSSDKFKAFIRLVQNQFDVILIDTPPVMITPEPLSLAEVTDGVIFVCRSGITAASEAREAIMTLQNRDLRVAVILNGVKDTVFHRSRYNKYSYYYQMQPKSGELPKA